MIRRRCVLLPLRLFELALTAPMVSQSSFMKSCLSSGRSLPMGFVDVPYHLLHKLCFVFLGSIIWNHTMISDSSLDNLTYVSAPQCGPSGKNDGTVIMESCYVIYDTAIDYNNAMVLIIYIVFGVLFAFLLFFVLCSRCLAGGSSGGSSSSGFAEGFLVGTMMNSDCRC